MPSYEIKYDTSNVSEAQAKAVQDCKDWLGSKGFDALMKEFERVNGGGASPKREIEVALMMIGIQGYPAQVLVEFYSK